MEMWYKTYVYPPQGICNNVERFLTSYWRIVSIQYAFGICETMVEF